MAVARCAGHRPQGRTLPYVDSVRPVGVPCAVLCGITACEEDALIWLTVEEKPKYDSGQRIFTYKTQTSKVRAQ